MSDRIYGPEDFPTPDPFPDVTAGATRKIRRAAPGAHTQSERDWAYAKRALARGGPEELVIAAIAVQRRYDKHNPRYYAEHTVRKAAQSLATEARSNEIPADQPSR